MAECMRCSHQMNEISGVEEYDIEVREFHCPHCGAIEILHPCPEEDKHGYVFYNDNAEDTLGGSDHGYPGLCPQCGSHIIWECDFMRSEVLGDVDETELDEYGIAKDDSLATVVFCPHCGASIDVVDAKPSEYCIFPYWKEEEGE